ncbi:filamentous hemagglutinin family protein, partial [Methylicorpusculum sp.]|uniref:filamentous haemagglutinin family protein n=1 Tax=Methylicorpusculum sp. TaxID=2713644 RepID=UPI002ABAE27A
MSTVIGRIDPFGGDPKLLHATVPVHKNDIQPVRLVSRQGDIENIGFSLAKKAIVKAGQDITNLSLSIQHVNAGDVSLLEAGRDLRDTSDRDPATGALLNNSAKIEISGPGEVLVKTGRNVDLGASEGISTVGNVVNTSLPEQGANLTILAGANGELNYAGFIDAYLRNNDQYSQDFQQVTTLISDFMRQTLNDNSLTDAAAMEAFAQLKSEDFVAIQPQLNAIVQPVLFNEIRENGKASAKAGSLDFKRGFAAIATLFPGSDWKGDLSLFFSKIQTIDGGNINLIVPGGQINAGLAASFSGAKSASELGIVAQRSGDINALVRDDFLINQSRVFALDGGNILMLSTEGNIDAGRGAKSAIAAPPPVISFDDNGNLKIEFPPVVSGSGIRTAASSEGIKPGGVSLFAPHGVIDAGEAGIDSGGFADIIGTLANASNFKSDGPVSGVAPPPASVAAGMTGTSNSTAGVSQGAESSVNSDVGKNVGEALAKAILGILSVD